MQLPESTPPSQNISPFSTTICDPPRIYPPSQNIHTLFNNYMRPCDPPRIHPPSKKIYPPFQQRNATLPESTSPSQNIPPFSTYAHLRPSQNLSLPPRLYLPLQQLMRSSQNLPPPSRIYLPFQQLYATLPESTPLSQNLPPFSTTKCDHPRIYPSLPEYTPFSTTIIICDPPRIYPGVHSGRSQNLPGYSFKGV